MFSRTWASPVVHKTNTTITMSWMTESLLRHHIVTIDEENNQCNDSNMSWKQKHNYARGLSDWKSCKKKRLSLPTLTSTTDQNHTPQTSEGAFCRAGTQSSCFQSTLQEPVGLTQFCPPGSGKPEEDKPQLYGPITTNRSSTLFRRCLHFYFFLNAKKNICCEKL